jgi:hypothetical protein
MENACVFGTGDHSRITTRAGRIVADIEAWLSAAATLSSGSWRLFAILGYWDIDGHDASVAMLLAIHRAVP